MIIQRMLAICSSILILGLGSQSSFSSSYELVVTVDDLTTGEKVEEVKSDRVYSPYAGRNYPDQVLFGDMHFHTDLSFDAGLVGTSLDAHDGFKVARGEKVISNSGQHGEYRKSDLY